MLCALSACSMLAAGPWLLCRQHLLLLTGLMQAVNEVLVCHYSVLLLTHVMQAADQESADPASHTQDISQQNVLAMTMHACDDSSSIWLHVHQLLPQAWQQAHAGNVKKMQQCLVVCALDIWRFAA